MTTGYLKVDLMPQGGAEHFQLAFFLSVLPQHDFFRKSHVNFQVLPTARGWPGGAKHADTATAGTSGGSTVCPYPEQVHVCPMLGLALWRTKPNGRNVQRAGSSKQSYQ